MSSFRTSWLRPAASVIGLLAILTAGSAPLLLSRSAPSASPESGNPDVTVVAWNDLGMHCLDPDFSVFAILPPFNTLNAQVIEDGDLLDTSSPYSVSFEGVADASGSINTTSAGKTNFWHHVADLFGVSPPVDEGLTGNRMPGSSNTPQPLGFDAAFDWFQAEGIPFTPIDDALLKNPYPLVRVVVRDQQGTEVASTVTSAPNSTELECSTCHASGASPAAQPAAGWVFDSDPLRDDRLNILRLHDDRHLGSAAYTSSLQAAGYMTTGLYDTVVTGGKAILCAACHGSNALPGTGMAGITPLTQAIHATHADVRSPDGLTLDAQPTRQSCFLCHPGRDTQCLRGAMGTAIGPDGRHSMECQSCHGGMADVGDPNRTGWLDQPSCQNCHTGTATQNSGAIRFTSAFDASGELRPAASQRFASEPDVPSPGFSLYRLSRGHGDLQCSACHGPPHAIYPSAFDNDNEQSIRLQGHAGTLTDCNVCHDDLEDDEYQGPHGMHPVDSKWVRDNHGNAMQEQGIGYCQSCHGPSDGGTVLSRAQGDRSYSNSLGTQTFFEGSEIGCYACHQGPSSSNAISNGAPVVSDVTLSTSNDVSLPLTLTGFDPDGDPIAFRIVKQPAFRRGSVALQGANATYIPEPGFVGTATFTYAARDGKIDSNLGTVTVNVNASTCAATVESYGFGCAGSGGFTPRLSLSGCPERGSSVVLRIDQALGGAPAVITFGRDRATQPLPYGCVLRVGNRIFTTDVLMLSGTGAGQGFLDLPVTIPPSLPPGTYTIQAFNTDPNAPGSAASTNALELLIP